MEFEFLGGKELENFYIFLLVFDVHVTNNVHETLFSECGCLLFTKSGLDKN